MSDFTGFQNIRLVDLVLYGVVFIYQSIIAFRLKRAEEDHEKVLVLKTKFDILEKEFDKLIEKHENNHGGSK